PEDRRGRGRRLGSRPRPGPPRARSGRPLAGPRPLHRRVRSPPPPLASRPRVPRSPPGAPRGRPPPPPDPPSRPPGPVGRPVPIRVARRARHLAREPVASPPGGPRLRGPARLRPLPRDELAGIPLRLPSALADRLPGSRVGLRAVGVARG